MILRFSAVIAVTFLGMSAVYAAEPASVKDAVAPKKQIRTTERGKSGDFDYYTLSLSWSPSYCVGGRARRGDVQCDPSDKKYYGMVVHGLWPQKSVLNPQYCGGVKKAEMDKTILDKVSEFMPSKALITHQWRKHGVCSGVDQITYFSKIETAYKGLSFPSPLKNATTSYQRVQTAELKKEFLNANKGLKEENIALYCRGNVMQEMRICYTKDMKPTACGDAEKRGQCKAPAILVPPVI